jgi:GH15 family glucan-1,4-alpha-glucosidase
MGRPVVLSNGQLFVGLDEHGLVHDFYYPYVGLENLTTARHSQHKIGVWVDKQFSWTDDGTWETQLDFEEDALISDITLHSKKLGVSLHFQDCVDSENNAFIRQVIVTNDSDKPREIRLFMHQVFQLSADGRADTALYVPDDHYIFDYKGRYCLLIAGKFSDNTPFDQYAVGSYGIEGKEGTFLDAEDGELSNNTVEHGGVDSVIRFAKEYEANGTATVQYWIVAGSSQPDVQAIHKKYKEYVVNQIVGITRQYWRSWLSAGHEEPDFHKRSILRGLFVIKAHCDDRGSVLASGDSSIFNYGRDYYCYCWPRDAAYALWPLIRLGHYEEARKFMGFARDIMHKDGYLMHKYQPDRAIGSTWHPLVHENHKELAIQEDETALVLYMMGEYYDATKDKEYIESFYPSFIEPAANFMASYIDKETGLPHASYDLWEEKFLTTTYTASTVIAGLEAAAKFGQIFEKTQDVAKWRAAAQGIRENFNKFYRPAGYFCKGFYLGDNGKLVYDETVDISSLYGPFMFAELPLTDQRMQGTLKAVEQKLLNVTPSGGVIRYENDGYFRKSEKFKGNPWIVCTLWLAQYYNASGRVDAANRLLYWAMERELPSGVLSEQFDPETASPLGVTPLVWSHAEMVNTLLDLSKGNGDKKKETSR